jgi:hypothetical protein
MTAYSWFWNRISVENLEEAHLSRGESQPERRISESRGRGFLRKKAK